MEALVWKAKTEENREKRGATPMGNRFGQRDPEFAERARAQERAG